MRLKGMSIDEAKAVIISYARNNIIANTRVGIAFDTALRELDKIESRPKAKWIEDTGLYATCSNCKENLYQAIEYKFCPNCGAYMRGE